MKRYYVIIVCVIFTLHANNASFAQDTHKYIIQGVVYQIHKGSAYVLRLYDENIKRHKLYLKKVHIPDSVMIEGDMYCVKGVSLMGCRYLKEVRLPNKLTCINPYAFAWCSSLQNVVIPNEVSHIYGEAFRGCYSLLSIKLPDSLRIIGNSAFINCTRLKSIEIPQYVRIIEDGAFEGCRRLKYLILPQSIDTIGCFAFGGCKGLREIYVYAKEPPILVIDSSSLQVFDGVKRSIPIHVVKGSKSMYLQASEWKLFTNYIDDL